MLMMNTGISLGFFLKIEDTVLGCLPYKRDDLKYVFLKQTYVFPSSGNRED